MTTNLTDLNDLPRMNRWLFKEHSVDAVSQVGHILTRYRTFRALPIPEGGELYGAYNWRLTEHCWVEDPYKEGAELSHGTALNEIWPADYNEIVGNPPNSDLRCDWGVSDNPNAHPPVMVFCNTRPDDDFKGKNLTINDGPFFRFVVSLRYPGGVPFGVGDEWFINEFMPVVCQQDELLRAFSFKAIPPPSSPFQRVLELWYRDSKAWKRNWVDTVPAIKKPDWETTSQRSPYLEPYKELVCIFLEEMPERDYLRDMSPYFSTF